MTQALLASAFVSVLLTLGTVAQDGPHEAEPRPAYHFTPEKNWMNDPNGLVWSDGEYHLFYQHNPYDKVWGHMSWGHAVSADLVHWRRLPIAIMEDANRRYTIFSGSAVMDRENTSGFAKGGAPPMVAIYTADHRPKQNLQNIHIASSTDRGRTFTKYSGNPVIDVGASKFGDPKVSWHEPTRRWIMVNILGRPQGRVSIYGSKNLREWEHLSDFRADAEMPFTWECPELFPLSAGAGGRQVKWVLKANGGGRSWYFVGEFDGRQFKADGPPRQFNYGPTYAEQTYNGIPAADGRRILLAWTRMKASEGRAWTGMQSVPREVTLRRFGSEYRLCQAPARELRQLRTGMVSLRDVRLDARSQRIDGIRGHVLELIAEIDPGNAKAVGVRLAAAGNGQGGIEVRYAKGVLDAAGVRAPVELADGERTIRLHILMDHGVLEVFAHGRTASTALYSAPPERDGVEIFAEGGTATFRSLSIWKLKSS